jgi:hypothetical protein
MWSNMDSIRDIAQPAATGLALPELMITGLENEAPAIAKALASLGQEVMLNPQPLPPGPPEQFILPGQEAMLNPQPLPPDPPPEGRFLQQANPGQDVMLNPQPLPPDPPPEGKFLQLANPGQDVMLNPQPLPPDPPPEANRMAQSDESMQRGMQTSTESRNKMELALANMLNKMRKSESEMSMRSA